MKLIDVAQWISNGGVLLILVLMMIEITPTKINPVQWFGNRWNKGISERVDKINKKLDEHIAEDYRNNILNFQNKIIAGKKFPQEQWKKVISSCSDYTKYCDENDISNDVIDETIKFIKMEYQKCLADRDFVELISKNENKNKQTN